MKLREAAAMAAVESIARSTAEAWTRTEEGVKFLKHLVRNERERKREKGDRSMAAGSLLSRLQVLLALHACGTF